MSPSSLTIGLAELASINVYVWKLLLFRVASFSSELFLMSPFAFLGLPLFFIRGLFDESFCIFEVASFFIRGLSDEPICVFGVTFFSSDVFLMSPFALFGLPLFSSEVFLMSPFAFLGLSFFFIGGLSDKPINEGSKSTPLFVALLVCTKVLVECQANLVSYFDLAPLWFLGNEVFIDASGYVGSITLP
jgi:hypothetical protein